MLTRVQALNSDLSNMGNAIVLKGNSRDGGRVSEVVWGSLFYANKVLVGMFTNLNADPSKKPRFLVAW